VNFSTCLMAGYCNTVFDCSGTDTSWLSSLAGYAALGASGKVLVDISIIISQIGE